MPRIKLTLAYDGTDYCGWAPSAGRRTIHSTVTESLYRATRQHVEIVGGSRTDSGAHAVGQVCHFDTDLSISTEKWPEILNRVLPPDISVTRAEIVSHDFHSRFCAEDRSYKYRIQVSVPNPFDVRFTHQHMRPLDIEVMQRAALLLVGRHDFRAFTAELDPSVENTVRTLHDVRVHQDDGEVAIVVRGTAFLRGMMRRIAGGLLEVGKGQRRMEELGVLLTPLREQVAWPIVLPAKGLCLMHIRYADPPIDHRVVPGM